MIPAERVLEYLKERNEAEARLRQENPSLARLYDTLIANRYSPAPHGRNDFLVQAVPFLYRAVAPQLIELLVMHFYRCHRGLFRDPPDQHRREARSLIEGVAASWRTTLSGSEGKLYEALKDPEKVCFRICRDLAMASAATPSTGEFFLSCEHLGDRLGIHPQQAQRLLRSLVGIGCMAVLEKGSRREAGARPRATSYRWLLPLPPVQTPP